MSRLEQDRAAAPAASKASQANAKRENATHTQGPWVVHPTAHHPAVRSVGTSDTGPRRICTVGSMNGNPVDKKNARLIAAAPELLDALDGLAAQVRPLLTELDIDGFQHSALKEAYDFACNVAGKATGEPQ